MRVTYSVCKFTYLNHGSVVRTFTRSIAALFLLSAVIAARSETTTVCPLRGDVPLNTVTKWIALGPEAHAVTLIKVCHVGFQLDAPALDTLSGTKATPAIYEALNAATAAKLFADQAHSQAEALQSAIPAATPAHAALYKRRIDYLEHASYVDLSAATFGSYDAKANRLTATLGGDEYWFDAVPAATEDTLFKNWPKVEVKRPYADSDLHPRTLTFGAIAVSGYSRKAREEQTAAINRNKIAPILLEAQAKMDSGDYDGAAAKYNEALAIVPDSQQAEDGLKKAEQLKNEQAAKDAAEVALGEWTDHATGLTWTIHGDDKIVPFNRAQEYCQNLRLGDHSDWRLPNKDELLALFDPAPKNQRTFRWTLQTYQYAMRGPIELTRPYVWSSNLEKKGSKNAWYVSFGNGESEVHRGIGVPGLEALCVRGKPDTHVDPSFSDIDKSVFDTELGLCNRGDATVCGGVGKLYEDGKYVERDYDKAMEYYHKSCQMGYDTGCEWAKELVNKLNKQANPK